MENLYIYNHIHVYYIFKGVNENVEACDKIFLRHFSEEYFVSLYLTSISLAKSLFMEMHVIFFSW